MLINSTFILKKSGVASLYFPNTLYIKLCIQMPYIPEIKWKTFNVAYAIYYNYGANVLQSDSQPKLASNISNPGNN